MSTSVFAGFQKSVNSGHHRYIKKKTHVPCSEQKYMTLEAQHFKILASKILASRKK